MGTATLLRSHIELQIGLLKASPERASPSSSHRAQAASSRTSGEPVVAVSITSVCAPQRFQSEIRPLHE